MLWVTALLSRAPGRAGHLLAAAFGCVRETFALTKVPLHWLALAAYLSQTFSTSILCLVVDLHHVVEEGLIVPDTILTEGAEAQLGAALIRGSPLTCMGRQCRLPGACSSPSKPEGEITS